MTSNSITFISDFIDICSAILQLWQTNIVSSKSSLFCTSFKEHIMTQESRNDYWGSGGGWKRTDRKRTRRNSKWTYGLLGQSPSLNSEACNQYQASLHGICGGESRIGKGFLQALQFSTSGLYSFSSTTDAILYNLSNIYYSMALVRERTIPTERPPPVGEVSANFCG